MSSPLLNQETSSISNSISNVEKKFFLKIIKGAEKGTVFQLSSKEILIGRDPSNHIQLKNDSKVSRHHIRFSLKDNIYYVQDITKNNFMVVNGIKTKHTELKNNVVIQVGDHVIQFIESTKNQSEKGRTPSQQPDSRNRLRLVLIAIMVAGGSFFLIPQPSQNNTAVKKIENFESNELSERRIDSIDETIKELGEKFKESSLSSGNGRNANSIFVQGKRDFDRGQFFYAKDAFGAVLSLEPDHSEARRMLRLSQQYGDNILEKQFAGGLENKEAGRFDLCKSDMKNIMNLLNDTTNPRYQEARKVLMECELKKRGNF